MRKKYTKHKASSKKKKNSFQEFSKKNILIIFSGALAIIVASVVYINNRPPIAFGNSPMCNTKQGDYCLGPQQATCGTNYTLIPGNTKDAGCSYKYYPGGGGPNGAVVYNYCCKVKPTPIPTQTPCARANGICSDDGAFCGSHYYPIMRYGKSYGCTTQFCCFRPTPTPVKYKTWRLF